MNRLAALALLAIPATLHAAPPTAFLGAHCVSCHDAGTKKGGLDLTAALDAAGWIKVHDRMAAGEMPPKSRPRPPAADLAAAVAAVRDDLIAAEKAEAAKDGRTRLRRLTRAEYENTVRDLLDLQGLLLQADLPPDGQAHGFDRNADALDLSHVTLARYLETADRALDAAVATRPRAPAAVKQRISLASSYIVAHVVMNGDGVILKGRQPHPDFPPAGEHGHHDQGAHDRLWRLARPTVGLFRHEDESFNPYFSEFVAIYPGRYRLTTSLWAFGWDQGKVVPARGTEAARLSIVQMVGDGRGGGHPSTVLGYYDAPPTGEQVHVVKTWLNPRETIGYNTASLAPTANYFKKRRALEFTGPGIACDYLEVEGPLHDTWPPLGHERLFGDLPITKFDAKSGVRPPPRQPDRQQLFMGRNKADPVEGVWSVSTSRPLEDADKLLAEFLPRAFRRPVSADTRKSYVDRVAARLTAGDSFEVAMRWAYRAALCSPDFLYHVEPAGPLDDFALANRLSYMLWNSLPDDALTAKAKAGELRKPGAIKAEAARMLADPKAQRFADDFLGQWLKLRLIAANDPDRKLYPEFSRYLQDSMMMESLGYFRELLDKDLPADYLVRSDFAVINQRLAAHYGIPGVVGCQVRRVPQPAGNPRGPFLTQAAVLKVTANGTTTSPVPRGAFVLDRLLGRPPEPPPPNVPAVEPDVRGAVTIREQLEKHRADVACAGCHARIDPPGFALEEFDVIGGQRSRYRSLGTGDPAPRGTIDPFIGIGFRLGPKVDPSSVLPDGRGFKGVGEFQALLAADRDVLLANLARQFAVYGTGRGTSFGDRTDVAALVAATNRQGGGVRTLLNELVESKLFRTR